MLEHQPPTPTEGPPADAHHGLTEIRSGPPIGAPGIAAFSRLAHVVESAAQMETPAAPPTESFDIHVVHGPTGSFERLRDKAQAELDEADAAYEEARRVAAGAWATVREDERRLVQAGLGEEAAERELEMARQRRRAVERRLRRARLDAETASRHCSDASRRVQDAQLRADRL